MQQKSQPLGASSSRKGRRQGRGRATDSGLRVPRPPNRSASEVRAAPYPSKTRPEDDTYDLVWGCESGEHMPDKKKYIEDSARPRSGSPLGCLFVSVL